MSKAFFVNFHVHVNDALWKMHWSMKSEVIIISVLFQLECKAPEKKAG